MSTGKTSLTVAEAKAGQLDPTDSQQAQALALWENLPSEWTSEEAFTRRLRKLADLEEEWKDADVSLLLTSLIVAEPAHVHVRRTPMGREMRRSPERPRYYSFAERAENSTAEASALERDRLEREEDTARERVRELNRPEREAEREQIFTLISEHPDHGNILLTRSEVLILKNRLQRIEEALSSAGLLEQETATAAADA
jgi:hypothetical protein